MPQKVQQRRSKKYPHHDPFVASGRWSLIRSSQPVETDRYLHCEHIARVLLGRYGIVFRKLLDQEDKLTLREEALKLDELQHENSKLLQTRMKVSQTIMDSIVNLAKNRTKACSTSYGSQGKYSPLDNSKNAIAINRTL